MNTVAKRFEVKSGKGKIYYQTLEGHVYDCLKILKCYFERNQRLLESICEMWEIQPDDLMRNLFITVYLHDIGKLTTQFQERINENKRSSKYPHPFFGFPIALEIFKTRMSSLYSIEGYPLIEPLSILSHHTQLHDNLYKKAEIRRVTPLEKEIQNFLDNIQEAYYTLGFEKFFDLKWNMEGNLLTLELLKNERCLERISKYLSRFKLLSRMEETQSVETLHEMVKIKSIFTFFLSIMKLCDFYSSAHFSDFCESNEADQVLGSILEYPEKYVLALPGLSPHEILGGNEPYHYQSEIAEESTPYSFLFAPCGRGKTEAALLWALEICKKFNKNKVVFAMPTQTTSNALMDRFVTIVDSVGMKGAELVGLYHGKSRIKLEEKFKEQDEEEFDELDEDEMEEVKSENFKGNIFFKPITVTTVDHLILSFVHGFPQADFACGNLQGAVIVFDEVHYYERQTLKQLVDLFAILRKMGIPHLLMSGTLPEFIKTRLINDSVKDGITYSYVEDEKGLSFTPFKIESFSTFLIEKGIVNNDIIQEIKKNYAGNFNQFIIVNTVKRAQQIYAAIKNEVDGNCVYLVHSQFTYGDRAKKEKNLINAVKAGKRPLIVVSTQVIEISLDISCDIMYTEGAPVDSLGQRAGRLNRQGESWKKDNYEFLLKIYPPEGHLPYDKDILEESHANLKDGVHSYRSLKKACDSVYTLEYLEKFERESFEGTFCFLECGGTESLFKRCFLFGLKHKDIAFSEEEGNHFVIRSEKYRKFDVIPEMYYKNEEKNLCVKNQAKVPYWWIDVDLRAHGGELQWFEPVEKQFRNWKKVYWLCRLPYCKKDGFDSSVLEKENEKVKIENIL